MSSSWPVLASQSGQHPDISGLQPAKVVCFVQVQALEADLFGRGPTDEGDNAQSPDANKADIIWRPDRSHEACEGDAALDTVGTARNGPRVRKAAWVDDDDRHRPMQLAAVPKLRKLRHHKSEDEINGVRASFAYSPT